jgi:chromosome segregation ATPase
MPDPDASSQGQDLSQTETQWHDRILSDAIGYTRSLAAVLESLTEGFRRRGRDLEEHKQRLTILQNERRSVLEERSGLEATLRGLTSERDTLQAGLEAKDREIRQLRQDLEQGQGALAARSREVQELQAAVAVSTRQTVELREIVRKLERERDSRVHAAQRLADVERELLRARETADRAQEGLARSDRVIASLRESLESERRALITERDTLQASLVEKDQELGHLRQALEDAKAAMVIRVREADELQAALTVATRQVEELSANVRELQREVESASHQVARIPVLERDLDQEREASRKAQAGQADLHEALTTSEERLAAAQRDLASAQQLAAGLRAALDEGMGRTTILEMEAQAQEQECVRLGAAVQSLRGTLSEIASIVAIPPVTTPPDLVMAVRRLAELAAQAQAELASLKSLLEPLHKALGTTENLSDRVGELLTERRAFERQLREIMADRQRLQEELAESARREQRAREEAQRLSEQVGVVTTKLEVARAAAVAEAPPEPATPGATATAQGAEAPPAGPAIVVPPEAPPVAPAPEAVQATPVGAPQPAPSGMGEPQSLSSALPVECKLEGAGEDTLELLHGQPSRINEVGMVIAFYMCLPAGRVVTARLTRGGREFSVAASVVRTQPSKGTTGGPSRIDHLIRFEHPNLDSSRRLKEFLA